MPMTHNEIVKDILRRARAVRASEERIGVYSTGEQIAVALVLNKPELFPHGGYTILEAIEHLGPDWTAAALQAQRLLDMTARTLCAAPGADTRR